MNENQQYYQGNPQPGGYPGQQPGGYQQQYQQPGGFQQPYQQQAYQQPARPYVETTANNAFNCGPEGKSRGVYAILALVLGSIGLHYFYINKVGAGILTIVIVLITCGALAIVPLIQGILALWTMTNEEFDRKFVATNNFFPLF